MYHKDSFKLDQMKTNNESTKTQYHKGKIMEMEDNDEQKKNKGTSDQKEKSWFDETLLTLH